MRIWGWGANTNGQLGLGRVSEQESSPTEIPLLALPEALRGKVVGVAVTGGAGHTIALLQADLSLSEEGELEQALDRLPTALPIPPAVSSSNPFLLLSYPAVYKIAAGFSSYYIVDVQGRLFTFGENGHSQLGLGAGAGSGGSGSSSSSFSLTVERAQGLPPVTSIAAGLRHVVAVSCTKDLYVWGDNSKGQLGVGDGPSRLDHPFRLQFPFGFRFDLAGCGKDFTIAVHESGCIFGCGQNRFGVLLHAPQDIKEFREMTHIYDQLSEHEEEEDVRVRAIKCGWSHVMVLMTNGKVVSWGRNNFGQLGRVSVNPEFCVEPGFVRIDERVVKIAVGSEHNLALGESGKVYAWGWNEHDNCGVHWNEDDADGMFQLDKEEGGEDLKVRWSKDCIPLPTVVKFPDGVGKAVVIGCGAGSSFAVTD